MAKERDTWVMLRVISPQGRTFAVPKVELESEVTWGRKEVGGVGAIGIGTLVASDFAATKEGRSTNNSTNNYWASLVAQMI